MASGGALVSAGVGLLCEVQECIIGPGGDGRIAHRTLTAYVLERLVARMAREHPELRGLEARPPPSVTGGLDGDPITPA